NDRPQRSREEDRRDVTAPLRALAARLDPARRIGQDAERGGASSAQAYRRRPRGPRRRAPRRPVRSRADRRRAARDRRAPLPLVPASRLVAHPRRDVRARARASRDPRRRGWGGAPSMSDKRPQGTPDSWLKTLFAVRPTEREAGGLAERAPRAPRRAEET